MQVCGDLVLAVATDFARGEFMPGIGDPRGEDVTRAVVGQRARVGDGQQRDPDGLEAEILVDRHQRTLGNSGQSFSARSIRLGAGASACRKYIQ